MMGSLKTTVAKAKRKALNKEKRIAAQEAARINVPKLLEALEGTTVLNQQLMKAGADRERAVSVILEEYEVRIKAIEEQLGIKYDQKSKESDNKRRSGPETRQDTDTIGSDNEHGRMLVSPVRPAGADLCETPSCGDGALPDQADEDIPGESEVVLDGGDSAGE